MRRSVLIPHAAKLLGVSRRTVYYRIREGRLKTVRTVGGSQRVLMESIEASLQAQDALAQARSARGSPSPGGLGPAGPWF